MELRDYLKIIARYSKLFIVCVILTAAFALVWSKLQPRTYSASTTFTVNKTSSLKQKDAQYYLYDNYYNVQSAGLFSQIVATWFESPSLVKEIYEQANVEVPNVSQKKLSRTFKAVREEPATINVSYVGTNVEETEKLIQAVPVILQRNVNNLGKNSEFFYEIAQFEPVITENNPNMVLNGLIGLISGALLGVFLAFSVQYFKAGK